MVGNQTATKPYVKEQLATKARATWGLAAPLEQIFDEHDQVSFFVFATAPAYSYLPSAHPNTLASLEPVYSWYAMLA